MTEPLQPGDALFAAIVASSNDALLSTTIDGTITSWNPAAERLFGYSAAEAIGRPSSILLPPGQNYGFPWPFVLLSDGEALEPHQTRRAHKDGHLIDVMLTIWAVRDAGGQITGVAGIFREISTNPHSAQNEQTDAQRLVEHQLRALTRVSASLTYDQSMETTLDALAASVVEVTQAVACTVALIDDEQQLYRVAGTYGLPAGYAQAVESAYHAGARISSLEAYRSYQLVRRTVRTYIQQDPDQAQLSALVQGASWDVVISVPLVFRDHALGAVTCCYPVDVEPDEQELDFLIVVADQAAVAVQTARLFADLQGKAALEERQRLARELHDSVSQALFGIGLGARTARTLLDRDPVRAAEPLDFVISLAEAGLTEMRALIFELRPDALETEGLVTLLEQQAAALRSRHGLHVETTFGSEPDVPLPVKETLYRIAQEALHNTAKHSRAKHVSLSLCQQPEGIILDVSDDGIGFDPSAAFPGHLGLRSMRERAILHGATVEIRSVPGGGAHTHVFVPTAP